MTDKRDKLQGLPSNQETAAAFAFGKNSAEFGDFLEKRCRPYIVHTAKKFKKDPNDIDDIVQQVFLQVIRYFDSYSPDKNFNGWLNTIESRILIKNWKKDQKFPHGHGGDGNEFEESVVDDHIHENLIDIIKSEDIATINNILDSWPDNNNLHEVEIFRRKINGNSSQEIANDLKIKPGTVDVRYHRFLLKLHDAISSETSLLQDTASRLSYVKSVGGKKAPDERSQGNSTGSPLD